MLIINKNEGSAEGLNHFCGLKNAYIRGGLLMLLPLLGALAAVNIPRALTPSSSSSLGIAVANSALRSLLRRLPRAMRLLGLQPAP